MADPWRGEDTIWADVSRLDNGNVGAAYCWKTPSGWTGRRFHLGTNNEVFGAEVYAIYQALSIIDREQGRGIPSSWTLLPPSIGSGRIP